MLLQKLNTWFEFIKKQAAYWQRKSVQSLIESTQYANE